MALNEPSGCKMASISTELPTVKGIFIWVLGKMFTVFPPIVAVLPESAVTAPTNSINSGWSGLVMRARVASPSGFG